MKKHKTREAWLLAAISAMRPWFRKHGAKIPRSVQASVGFTSKGQRSNRIGEAWIPEAHNGVATVYIHPKLDAMDALGTLIHELVHTALPPDAKHGPKFRSLATALGLIGKMTATKESEELKGQFKRLIKDKLGPYPHHQLTAMGNGPKQSTRLRKWVCPECGQILRAATDELDARCNVCVEDFELAS